MKEKEIEIPIENRLQDFKMYLEICKRTIFSAKFGDGKTYFLNKFKNTYTNDYYFITLYPINYSISENQNIFEFIKRDILLQLANDGKLNPIDFEGIANSIFTLENLKEVISFLISSMPQGEILNKILEKSLIFAKLCNKKYRSVRKYKSLFALQKGGLYEHDSYTELIIETLKYIKNSGYKTVLIIEDLDRIDPAHFFRILNVLGAHIDENQDTNKFGFDNIITVFDYRTAEHIFKHFYGEKANYKGYINKFIDVSPFSYSIKSLAYQYFFDYFIAYECKIIAYDKTRIHWPNTENTTFSKIYDRLKDSSIRDLLNIIKSAQNIPNKELTWGGNTIILNSPLIRFIQTLKLIGYLENDIINLMMNTITDAERIMCVNTFLLYHLNYCQIIKYNGINYKLTSIKDDAQNIILSLTVERTEENSTITINNDDVKNCIKKAFEYIMV